MRVIVQDTEGNELFRHTFNSEFFYQSEGATLGIAVLTESLWLLQSPLRRVQSSLDCSEDRFISPLSLPLVSQLSEDAAPTE
jgi:hypothetical protein